MPFILLNRMKIGATFSDNRPSVAAIGFIDGVHRGHRYLIEQVREAASLRRLAASVVTFPVHPRRVTQPDCQLRLLTTCQEKTDLLAATGVDTCLMLDFTPWLASLSARDFMSILKRRYQIAVLVIGYDHRFGHNRSEGFEDYMRYGQELGMEVVPARAFSDRIGGKDVNISSSWIRRLLADGRVEEANEALGYDYFLQGTVVSGHQVGRRLGFPTANVQVNSPDKLIPADGVYAVWVDVDGCRWGGMLSIGRRPTLGNGPERSIEVNLFGFHADIYQHALRVTFVARTRGERKFGSLEELVAQLHKDEAEVKSLLQG